MKLPRHDRPSTGETEHLLVYTQTHHALDSLPVADPPSGSGRTGTGVERSVIRGSIQRPMARRWETANFGRRAIYHQGRRLT